MYTEDQGYLTKESRNRTVTKRERKSVEEVEAMTEYKRQRKHYRDEYATYYDEEDEYSDNPDVMRHVQKLQRSFR